MCRIPNAGLEFLVYGTESTTRSMQMQIVDALHLGDRSKASNLLLDLGHGNHSLRPDDFVHILNYCARSPDPLVSCTKLNCSSLTHLCMVVDFCTRSSITMNEFIPLPLGPLHSVGRRVKHTYAHRSLRA